MKRFILFSLLLVVCVVAPLRGAMTYDQNYYTRNKQYLGAGNYNDPLYNFWGEVEDVLEGAGTYTSIYFDPQTSDPSASEGVVYYNDTSNVLKLYTGSAWVSLDTAGGSTLDEAYDMGGNGVGRSISATDGAVAISSTDADTAFLLTLNASPGSSAALGGMEITLGSNATENGIEFENSGSGDDVQGTGDTWAITKAGAATFATIASVGDIQFSGSTYNVLFDASDEGFEFQDSATLNFGTSKDIAVSYDGSGDDLNITGAGKEIAFGADAAGLLVILHTDTTGDYVQFDEENVDVDFVDVDLDLGDDSYLRFGDSDDLTVKYDGSNDDLDILGSGLEIAIGADDEGIDVIWHTEVSGDYAFFDETNADLSLIDVDIDLDDDAIIAFGTGDDMVMDVSSDKLRFNPGTAGNTLELGTAYSDAIDVTWYGDTDGDTVAFDEENCEVLFTDIDLQLDDAAVLSIGTNDDFTVYSDTANTLEFDPGTAGNGILFGTAYDDAVDLTWYGDTDGDTVAFDEENCEVLFTDIDIQLDDAADLIFGTNDDFTMESDTASTLEILPGTAGNDVKFGVSAGTSSPDIYWYADTNGDYVFFDEENVVVNFTDVDLDLNGGSLLILGNDAQVQNENDNRIEFTENSESLELIFDTDKIELGAGSTGVATLDFNDVDALEDLESITGEGTGVITGFLKTVTVDIDDRALAVTESGDVFTNGADSDTTVFTLPSAAAGYIFTFMDVEAAAGADLCIKANTGDKIQNGNAAEYYNCYDDTYGSTVTLIAVDDTEWVIQATNGTWTADNNTADD